MTAAAGLLVAAIAVPVIGITGVATRDTAGTFNTLSVPALAQVPTRSEILDASGRLIAYYYPHNLYRIPVTYDQIAPVMRDAIVAIEDSRFYQHGAMDPRGTFRALVTDANGGSTQGGSTLAQQYVKNALILTAPSAQAAQQAYIDTFERKIRELRIAANVEHELTKQQLLAAYLDVAYFENNAYGIQVAAGRYFSRTALDLTLPESAMLAGMVEYPTLYNPFLHPQAALGRRATVLRRMAQLGYISQAAAAAAIKSPLGLRPSTIPLQTGCTSASARDSAFFCQYVLDVIQYSAAQHGIYTKVWNELNGTGGLTIYTTMNEQDQRAAEYAVNYVEPANDAYYNPGRNGDTEVLIQPGTGDLRAIAVNRPFGYDPAAGQDSIDYAADLRYGGWGGVQQGSSAKIFTLITALEKGYTFGYTEKVIAPVSLGPYFSCTGAESFYPNLNNAEAPSKVPVIYSLYNGTTLSVNAFFGQLEQKVGLCSVVKTAARMGVHRGDGKSLFANDGGPSTAADDNPSFTLGSGAYISPMTMAAAYASVDARGIYCSPVAIAAIVNSAGSRLPVPSAGCHRDMPAAVADAANYILQGVLQTGTAGNRGISRPAAAKTGTGNNGDFAAFAGYTPTLAAYVSVFNPLNQFGSGAMLGSNSDYREVDGSLSEPGQMFGDNAPGATWQLTFLHADLGRAVPFVSLSPNSPFFSNGNGQVAPKPVTPPQPPKPPKRRGPPTNPGH